MLRSWLKTLRSWWQDNLLRTVLKNSGFMFSSNTVAAGLAFLNPVFITRLIGIEGLGVVAIVQTFVSNVNRLLSFRMSEVVVKYLGQAIASQASEPVEKGPVASNTASNAVKDPQAAALVKGIGLIEAATSIVAYLVLLVLASWAARVLVKEPSAVMLIPFYGLMLLANLVYETSTGVLQTHKRFDRLALINTFQSVLTTALIFLAFILRRGVVEILAAYLVGKALAGIAITVFAFRQMDQSVGRGWWRESLKQVADWKGIWGFAINTNLNGTVNLVTRDNAPLYLTYLSPASVAQSYVGYLKLGLSIINFITMPIDPFIWPTYAEITRTIAQRLWAKTRALLKQVSTIAGAWTLAVTAGIGLLGWWLIPLVYGADAAPVYPVVLILLVGYGTANVFNWNRPLLLAFGKPSYPLRVALYVGIVEILLILWLVPQTGYLVMAAILSGYLAVSVAITAWRGWHELRIQEALDTMAAMPAQQDNL
jgi:O-antigen/teichoic acid export membrane protein